ncbi:MAG: hypothetical protein Pg6A_20620 [Termitinemataceae bacterium]|nr:MAG: hypothetical protein Pg6A_20620 [Termitinemataceae bacterium]
MEKKNKAYERGALRRALAGGSELLAVWAAVHGLALAFMALILIGTAGCAKKTGGGRQN